MKKTMNFRVTSEDVTTSTGEVLTEADYEQMADEAEHAVIDVDRLLDRQRRGVGRPALGEGVSPVLQVRLDEKTRQQLAERAATEHSTPSAVVRDAIKAWLHAS